MAKTNKSFVRPSSPVSKWAAMQAQRWIRAAVKAGNVKFVRHATMRGTQRQISVQDAIDCIANGVAKSWLEGFDNFSHLHDMRMKFEYAKRTKTITAIVAVSDHDPAAVVVTVY